MQSSHPMQQSSGNAASFPPTLPRIQVSQSDTANLNTLLHQYLLRAQEGRLYPEIIPVVEMECALDMGCGAGEWIFDMAKNHPKLRIYGVDVDEMPLHRATQRRNAKGLCQIQLRHIDITQPLPVPDSFFDFVHMRRCTRSIAPTQWPGVIAECIRVLKPEGWLVMAELELCQISSPAMMAIQSVMTQARAKYGNSMHIRGEMTGMAPRLYGMLLQAQMDNVAYDLHTVDLGFMGGHTARLFLTEIIRYAWRMRPMVVEQQMMSSEGFDELIKQASSELLAPDLCGWGVLITAYGKRGNT